MPSVSIDLSSVGHGVFQFLSYMVLAIFAENVILSRALGVTRLLKLVPDYKAQIWNFALPLTLVMTLSAPFGWLAHNVIFIWLRGVLPAWMPLSALRPLVYLTCGVAAAEKNRRALPRAAQLGYLQHRCAGNAADLRQPELYHAAEHCFRFGQCAWLYLHRLYCA